MNHGLDAVQQGMDVCEPDGTHIGKVEWVQFGDEDPATPGPETNTVSPAMRDSRGSLVDAIADVFRPDDIPEPMRDRLLRNGFIRIDADGLFNADRYVMPDQIRSVSGDRVILSVTKDELMKG